MVAWWWLIVAAVVGANVSLVCYAAVVVSHCAVCEARRARWERIHFTI